MDRLFGYEPNNGGSNPPSPTILKRKETNMSSKVKSDTDRPIESKTPTGRYGIKAYGTWFCFKTKKRYTSFLAAWMQSNTGASRDRGVDAFVALWNGCRFWDSDMRQL